MPRLAFFIALIMVIAGCKDSHYIFRGDLCQDNSVMGVFSVGSSGVYSVAIESEASDMRRKEIFAYFGKKNRSSTFATLNIYRNNNQDFTLIKSFDVIKPSPTSWSNRAIFSELTRIKLEKGVYKLKVDFDELNNVDRSYINYVVIESAYFGK
ncbi:hypothetical protein ACVWWQ_003229 [Rhodanobacter sp. TND4EL1]